MNANDDACRLEISGCYHTHFQKNVEKDLRFSISYTHHGNIPFTFISPGVNP